MDLEVPFCISRGTQRLMKLVCRYRLIGPGRKRRRRWLRKNSGRLDARPSAASLDDVTRVLSRTPRTARDATTTTRVHPHTDCLPRCSPLRHGPPPSLFQPRASPARLWLALSFALSNALHCILGWSLKLSPCRRHLDHPAPTPLCSQRPVDHQRLCPRNSALHRSAPRAPVCRVKAHMYGSTIDLGRLGYAAHGVCVRGGRAVSI